jgi:hypothetical protein
LLTILKNQSVIAFIDDRYTNVDFIKNYIENQNVINPTNRVKIIPINLEWLKNNFLIWQKNDDFID